jgi:hypothetical protein
MSALIMANGRATTQETKPPYFLTIQTIRNSKKFFLYIETSMEIDRKIELWSILSYLHPSNYNTLQSKCLPPQ